MHGPPSSGIMPLLLVSFCPLLELACSLLACPFHLHMSSVMCTSICLPCHIKCHPWYLAGLTCDVDLPRQILHMTEQDDVLPTWKVVKA